MSVIFDRKNDDRDNIYYLFISEKSSKILAFGYCRCLRLFMCVCVRPCVNHELGRAITHDPHQIGSPNLDHRCKRPWLRSLLFLGVIDLDLHGQILSSKSKFTPFWACPRDYSSPVQVRATKFGPEVLNTLDKIPVVLGGDWAWHVKLNLFSKSCLFSSLLRLWNICETCKKRMKRSLFHILNGYAHIYVRPQKRVMDRGTVGLYL